MEYKFDKITVDVDDPVETDEGYTYTNFFVHWDDKGFGFASGLISQEHLAEAPEGEELEYFFENLGMSYWAKENGEDPKIYLSNINL
jgi:hypothetical protein